MTKEATKILWVVRGSQHRMMKGHQSRDRHLQHARLGPLACAWRPGQPLGQAATGPRAGAVAGGFVWDVVGSDRWRKWASKVPTD